MDWLIIENIKNIEHSKLDEETRSRLREIFRKYLRDEKKFRDQIEAIAKEGSILKKGLTITVMQDRDKVAEDHFQCNYCTDFAYISVIKCKFHKICYCLYH